MATSTAQAIATVPVWDYLMAPGSPNNPNPSGLPGKKVKVTLSYAQAQSAAPVTLLGTDPVIVQTDANGFWQVNLVPNNKISPSGTIYIVEIEGYRSYVIQVTDVGAPGIGWQSSAIATLPPVGGGAPGYTLPGGTTVLGGLTAQGPVVSQGWTVVPVAPFTQSAKQLNGGAAFGTNVVWAPPPSGGDDTAMLTGLLSGGNVVVFLQVGTYSVNATFSLSSLTALVGAGPSLTWLKLANGSNIVSSLLWIPSGTTDVHLAGFSVDGNRSNQASGASGIEVVNTSALTTQRITFEDVNVYRAYVYGFLVAGQVVRHERCMAEDCGLKGFEVSFGVQNPANPATGNITKDIHYVDCTSRLHFVSSSAQGFDILGPGKSAWGTLVDGVHYSNCHAELIGVTGTPGPGAWALHSQILQAGETIPYDNPIGIRNVTGDGCTAKGCSDGCLWIQGVKGVRFAYVYDGNAGGSVVSRGPGLEIQGASDIDIAMVVYDAGFAGAWIHTGDATTYNNPTANVTVHVVADHCGLGDFSANPGPGVKVDSDTTGLLATGIAITGVSRNSRGNGVEIHRTSDVNLDLVVEDNGQAGVGGSQIGVVLFGDAAYAQLSRTLIRGTIRDTRAGGARTQQYGIEDNSTNVGGQIVFADVENNATVNIQLSGSNTIVAPGLLARFGGGVGLQLDNNTGLQLANSAGSYQTLIVLDPTNHVLIGVQGSQPSNGDLVMYANGLQAAWLTPAGDFKVYGHLFPGAEALGFQVSGGFLHSTGVPSNANGNNNDWCISDNGHFYRRAGGVWADYSTLFTTVAVANDLRRSRQTPTEAVLVSGVDATAGEIVSVTLTANRVVGALLNPAIGQRITFELIQGGAGGFTISFNAAFKFTWSDTGNTVGKRSTISGEYNGTNWFQDGAQTPYV